MNTWIKVITAALFLSLSACVYQPTQTSQVVDDRPLVSFSVANQSWHDYDLHVDGVSYGPVNDYLAPDNGVRLISGQRLIEVRNGNQVLFSDTRYFGDSLNYTVEVK